MKTGIIVYSHTGNTLSVARKLQEKLSAAGHAVNIEEIKLADGTKPGETNFKITYSPDAGSYDALIFCSPVHGFSLSAVMTSYLSQLGSLKDKKTGLLVTQQFPYPWMGGNRAIGQMKKLAESKGAAVCGTGIVNWSSKKREEMIADRVDSLCASF